MRDQFRPPFVFFLSTKADLGRHRSAVNRDEVCHSLPYSRFCSLLPSPLPRLLVFSTPLPLLSHFLSVPLSSALSHLPSKAHLKCESAPANGAPSRKFLEVSSRERATCGLALNLLRLHIEFVVERAHPGALVTLRRNGPPPPAVTAAASQPAPKTAAPVEGRAAPAGLSSPLRLPLAAQNPGETTDEQGRTASNKQRSGRGRACEMVRGVAQGRLMHTRGAPGMRYSLMGRQEGEGGRG